MHARDVGAVGDFPAARPRRVVVDGRALVIVRRADSFFALRDTCAHQGARLSAGRVTGTTLPCAVGAPVQYGRQGEILRCPWHGWEYDLTSGVSIADPDRARVRSYPVRLQGDRVIVDLS